MYRAMVVDDEDYIRDLLVKNIRESVPGVEVVAVAGDGREALKSALEQKPDIIITDISMPFMNGLELIKELQRAGINSKNVVISGYDEFDYARQAISLGVKDYLLKPFLPRELRDVLVKIMEELDRQNALQQNMSMLHEQALRRAGIVREKALRNLLEGHENQDGDIELNGNCYMAGVIHLTGGTWDFATQEKVEEFLMLIRDGYFSEDMEIYAVSFDGSQLAAVWCGSSEHEAVFVGKVRKGIEKIQSSFNKYYQIQLTCALGRPYPAKSELAKSYREAMAVWRGTLEAGSAVLFYGEDGEVKGNGVNAEAGTTGQIRDWKNQIRLSVRTGQAGEALRQLDGLMKCYASLANKKNDYISVSVRELVYAIQGDMEGAGYDRDDTESTAHMQKRMDYGSLAEMKEMLADYIEKCCAVVSRHSDETKTSVMVKQIRLLIDSNIKNPELDLEWLAAQVHFSISYVRQGFKQYTGEGIGEYLIRKRMEQAGMLLQRTGLRIQEVAAECGYDNQRYFASSFKKYYGCTPTEFKKAVEEERLY